MKDAGGKVSVSQSATLKAADFFISAQPKNVETVEGTQVKLSVGAKCTSQFSCQWQRKSGTQWTNCASASASTLQLKAGAPTPGAYYRCVLTSASGATLYSNAARLRVMNSGFSWGAYLDSGDVEITGYSGSDQSLLVIPSVLDGKKVVSVGYMALMSHSEITQVDFPSTLVNIGYAAFQECTGLRQLALPASLKTIEAAAFGDCTELVSLVLPDGVVKVGEDQDSLLGAFENCVKLRSVVISAGMRKINARCFRCCSSLTDLVIPSNITQIGGGAFYDCDALTQVVIPGSVTRIEGNAFWGCDALTRVVIPKSVASIASAAFANCAALTICGEAGSCAQRYATENGLPFELIS